MSASSRGVKDAQQRAVAELVRVAPVADELATRLVDRGFAVALVGGSVRDAFLGRLGADLDFATDARPDDVLEAVRGWAEATWTTGAAFGTIGIERAGFRLEVTTYRSESYDAATRKPEVVYGDSLEADLARRDFTVNAMAVTLPDHTFVDPHDGLADLAARRLRTPIDPAVLFADDPLRMMRAARFAAQLKFTVVDEVVAAMSAMAERIEIVSAERQRDEFEKIVLADDPRRGIALLVDTGLADHVIPELPRLRATADEHRRHKDVYEHTLTVLEQAIAIGAQRGLADDVVVRLAALMHDVGKPKTRSFKPGGGVSFHHHETVGAAMTRARLSALRFSKHVIEDVARLVELHLRFHGYVEGEWTDSAVRRYVRDAGDLLERLHVLTRSDCTTRNRRKAETLRRAYDELEDRIAALAEQEALDAMRPPLDGHDVMRLLDVGPGRAVGAAMRFLTELRVDRGPMTVEEATEALLAWAADEGVVAPSGEPPEAAPRPET